MRTHRGCHCTPRTLSPEERQKILRSPPPKIARQAEWTPPIEYLMVARDMPPAAAAYYIARCEAWFEAQPPRRVAQEPRREVVDGEAVLNLIRKYSAYVPIEEYRRVGYSDEALENVRRHREWVEAHGDELQAEIDRRWPGSSKPKPKKVIKAVKKKMV